MSWHTAKAIFDANVTSVLELLDFDRVVIDTATDGLRAAMAELEDRHHRIATMLRNRAALLAQVRKGDSLRPKFETMFNQCVVLLVSYFDSAVHDVFRHGVIAALRASADVAAVTETLSVSWRALEGAEGERDRMFADLLVTQKNISFQDMKSIGRAFKDLLGVTVPKDATTDTIILGQASRHVIVHAGSVVDEKMIRQIEGATGRTLKREVGLGQPLRFDPAEVRELAMEMQRYVDSLCAVLDRRFGLSDAAAGEATAIRPSADTQ